MEVPAFLFQLLEKELQDIHQKLLTDVSKKYQLPLEEVLKEFIRPVVMVSEQKEKVVIVKKQKGRHLPDSEHRCMARVWGRGKGGQCTRKKVGDGLFCTQHIEKRKHGLITEAPPKEVFQSKTRALYK